MQCSLEVSDAELGPLIEQREETGDETGVDEPEEEMGVMEENMFGLASCTLIRDLYFMHKVPMASSWPRLGRVVVTMILTTVTIATQIFLMVQIKHYVTAKAVHDVRIAYDAFETHMYSGHTILTGNGFHRGVDGFFDPKKFYSLDKDVMSTVCRIPFSHPKFLSVILTVWTLSCVGELKELLLAAKKLLYDTKTVSNMEDAMQPADDDEKTLHTLKIVGITSVLKFFLAIIALSRLGICSVLLWMGCRWLVATTNFGDLVLNSVALVFVLELKDFLYVILVPSRNKRDLANTFIDSAGEKEAPNPTRFLGTFAWLVVAIIWVYFYVCYFQRVLPGYRWDVKTVCLAWINQRYSLTNTKQDLLG